MSRPKRTSRESAAALDAITTRNPKVMFTANANSSKQGAKGAAGSGVQPAGAGAPLGAQEPGADKMGGLPLPEVVRELLREREVLRWDFKEGVFEVMDGEEFERRFNDLRKVRNKAKAAGTERPFSRMYNFYVLEAGDKWAKTGTRFRPKGAVAQPTPEILEYVKAMEVPKSSPTPSPRSARPHASSEARSDRASSSPKVARASLQSSRAGAPSSTPSGAPVRRSNREPVPRHVPDALEQQQQQQHVRAPPETHRHQPSMLPASVLGKRSAPQPSSSSSRHHNAASATAAAGTSTQRSFPDKIRRILQQDGIYTTGSPRSSSTPTMMSVSSSPRAHSENQIFGLGSPRASMSASGLPSFDSPKAHLGGIAPRSSSSPSVEEFHHYSTTMYDMESYQQEAQVRYMVQYSHPAEAEPHDQERLVEIDDASSGFPTPESILGLVGDFQGSPLDLGMPELGHLGVDFAGGSRDHTLLSSYEQDADAQWCLV